MSCGVGHRHGLGPELLWLWCSCSSNSAPSLGTSICLRYGPKKKKKEKKRKEKKIKALDPRDTLSENFSFLFFPVFILFY